MAVAPIQTRALVLRLLPLRESDRLVELFTRECGLLRAVGKSVREERSKLRFSLEPYSLAEVTLVRGREVWRIRGAQQSRSFYRTLMDAPSKVRLVGNIFLLLSRLLAGEEQNRKLFDHVIEAIEELSPLKLSADELRAYESIMVLRILSELGYRLPRPDWKKYLDTPLTRTLCQEFLPLRREAVVLINEALSETHL